MHVLILIDLQNDFLPGGALAVSEGDQVIDFANRAMESFGRIVATQDWHPPNHGSFASQHEGVDVGTVFELDGLPQIAWPDHCVQGTPGAEFAPSLRVEKFDKIVHKGTNPMIDSYSGFFDNGHRQATGLDAYLRSIGAGELMMMGLATDYCVKYTVLDAIELGYRVRVALEGCRGVELKAGDVDAAIDEMRDAGAHILYR